MASKSTTKTTREDRAATLLAKGKIQLFVGRGYATVEGSQGGEYVITRESCTCPDFAKRGVDCKHRLATRQICEEFKALRAAAQRGETVRPSAALMQAIRWPAGATTPPAVEAVLVCADCSTPIKRGRYCTRCLDQQLFGEAA